MRLARIILTICFVIAAAAYGFTEVKDRVFTDHTSPVITADTDELTVSITASEEDLMAGLTASDDKDGDVTDSIVVTGVSDFITGHTFKVTYAAFDAAGNVGTYTREAVYSDYTSPRFSSEKPFIYTTGSTSSDGMTGITVIDCIDGDISGRIKGVVTSYDDYYLEPVTLSVTNSSGDEITADIMVQYMESEDISDIRPYMDSYIIYCTAGSSVNVKSHIIGVWSNNAGRTFEEVDYRYSTDDMTVDTSGVDYSMPGSYIVKITMNPTEETPDTGDAYITIVVLEG